MHKFVQNFLASMLALRLWWRYICPGRRIFMQDCYFAQLWGGDITWKKWGHTSFLYSTKGGPLYTIVCANHAENIPAWCMITSPFLSLTPIPYSPSLFLTYRKSLIYGQFYDEVHFETCEQLVMDIVSFGNFALMEIQVWAYQNRTEMVSESFMSSFNNNCEQF